MIEPASIPGVRLKLVSAPLRAESAICRGHASLASPFIGGFLISHDLAFPRMTRFSFGLNPWAKSLVIPSRVADQAVTFFSQRLDF
jgi:hypothetical protein